MSSSRSTRRAAASCVTRSRRRPCSRRARRSTARSCTGDASPQVLHRPTEVVSANRNQSLTTVFLYRVAEVMFPQSRFVEEAHALQRQLHIDFAQEVLRQFNGPSASAVSLDGRTFAARSDLSDPATLKRLL